MGGRGAASTSNITSTVGMKRGIFSIKESERIPSVKVNNIIQMASGGEGSDSYFKARTTELDTVLKSLSIADWSEEASDIRSALSGIAYWASRREYGAEPQKKYDEKVEKLRKLVSKHENIKAQHHPTILENSEENERRAKKIKNIAKTKKELAYHKKYYEETSLKDMERFSKEFSQKINSSVSEKKQLAGIGAMKEEHDITMKKIKSVRDDALRQIAYLEEKLKKQEEALTK